MKPALNNLVHLAKRFAGSLLARPLTEGEREWVLFHLLPEEQELWKRMSTADQRHAYGVAKRVYKTLRNEVTRPVIAAALLHDIGKIASNLGTFGRSAATILANVGVPSSRVAQYRAHNEIGRTMLQGAGSDPLTSQWAYEHELPPQHWTLDQHIAEALHAADDD